jgi:TolB-like protein
MRFFAELKRRKVVQTAIIYLAAAWVLLQVADLLLGILDVPRWALRLVFVLLVVGFPLALLLSWTHQLTASGPRRELDADEQDEPKASRGKEARAAAGLPPEIDESIAVLPFANMSDDPSNLHFADGLSEEVLNLLSRMPGLRVVARTSSFAFRNRAVGAQAISRELNVTHLLEGSVRRSGKRVRVAAQLIRGADASHLWSRSYDRDLEDIFAVQDDIASAVARELEIELRGGAAPRSWPTDPETYMRFLRGRQALDLASRDGYARAAAEFEAALAVDPRFAPAWAALGMMYWGMANNSLVDYEEGARLARENSEKALAIDPSLADPLALLGYLDVIQDADRDGGMARLERARQLEPHNPRILTRHANASIRVGRLDDAIQHCLQALRADPMSALAHAVYGNACYFAGRLKEAEAARRKVLALSPGWMSGHFYLGRVLLAQGRLEAALEEMQQEESEFWRLTGLALALHWLGRREDSDDALQSLRALDAQGAASYQFAQIHACRGEPDAAFEWLDRAVTWRDAGLTFLAVDPLLVPLHQDPRWKRFLRRHGYQAGPGHAAPDPPAISPGAARRS